VFTWPEIQAKMNTRKGSRVDDPINARDETRSVPEDWSFSKRTVLFQCPRKYYYVYFGASPYTAEAEQLKPRLQELKSLSNVHLRSGEILDLVIRTYLRHAAVGDRWSPTRVERWGLTIFRKDRDFNRKPQREAASEKFPPVKLLEYYYAQPNAEVRYESAEEKLFTAIRNFFQGGQIGLYREHGSRPEARIQLRISMAIDGATARGRLDLAFAGPTGFEIVDWKVGADSGADENLQVGFYGLWAREQADIAGPVRLTMAYLGEGSTRQHDLGQIHPRNIRARIVQDMHIMRTLQPFGATSNARAFTPCGQPRICAQCPFQSVCPQKE
jgi:PD-(D/E)XK nuclease superfamily